MTKDEAMQMALDALELLSGAKTVEGIFIYADQEIEALRAALAQHDEQIDIKGAEMNTNRSGNLHEVMHQAAWDSATRVPEGDIRALKHRIHELEGEVIGYKQILDTQPEPEPVAWAYKVNNTWEQLSFIEPPNDAYDDDSLVPLYTAPPQRKPLSDEQIEDVFFDMGQYAKVDLKEFARAIEAAHGIRKEK